MIQETTIQVAERIVKCTKGNDQPEEVIINAVSFNIECHIRDILKALKNINETSFSKEDRESRLLELEKKYNLPIRTYWV